MGQFHKIQTSGKGKYDGLSKSEANSQSQSKIFIFEQQHYGHFLKFIYIFCKDTQSNFIVEIQTFWPISDNLMMENQLQVKLFPEN